MLSRGLRPLARVAARATARQGAVPSSSPGLVVAFSTSCNSSKDDGASNGNKHHNNSSSLHPHGKSSSSTPSSSSSKPKVIKSTKPSSKVNARTSRLLRSQLGTAGATPTVLAGRRPSQAAKGGGVSQDTTARAAEEESTLDSETSVDPEQLRAVAWAVGDDDTSVASNLPRLQEAQAFATASSYDFQALIDSGRLPPDWRLLEDGQVIYLASWPVHHRSKTNGDSPSYSEPYSGSGEVFILRTGAYVTWGIDAEQASRFRRIVLSPRNAPRSVERGVYEEIGTEEMDFVANEEEVTKIVGDVLVIGQPPVDEYNSDDPWSPLLARLSFSAGLALSARLSSQEASLSTYLSSVQSIPRLLEEKGRVPISRREVVRKMGRLLKLRQMVNLEEGSKVEELELFWENAMMEKHYDSICQTLDIEPRFRSLNEQLDHAENLMDVLRALLTEGSSHRMELIIIALIAIEVTLALASHGYLGGGGEEEAEEEGEGDKHDTTTTTSPQQQQSSTRLVTLRSLFQFGS